jgi:hypothetical protein
MPYEVCGAGSVVSSTRRGSGTAGIGPEHRDRAREHEPARLGAGLHAGAQGVEQRARAVEVRAQAEVEIGLAFARHRRGEVEDAVEAFARERGALVEQRADASFDAAVGDEVGGRQRPGRSARAARWSGRRGDRARAALAPGASRRSRRRR